MKRIILLATIVVSFVCSIYAQDAKKVTGTGNFTGKGRETITLTPVGHYNREDVGEVTPDIYKITTSKGIPAIYMQCVYPWIEVRDIDGDGKDEVAIAATHNPYMGCWGDIKILDYYNGRWYLLSDYISIYCCDEGTKHLIFPGNNRSSFFAASCAMGSGNFSNKKRKYTINRKPYICDFRSYYNFSGQRVNL